ncbi:hypothetical protein [Komagataeibacter xylinus]|uniref:hypothetical protein n=1 Tax=Komagataeibacter xylinus TaxID=28448 RepID=UPI001031C481|nr:hypothetical protein [Komagataeibacter xylinus]
MITFSIRKEPEANFISVISCYGKTDRYDYQTYRSDLSSGINIGMTRAEVRHLWGEPDFSKDVMTLPAPEKTDPMDCYFKNGMKWQRPSPDLARSLLLQASA